MKRTINFATMLAAVALAAFGTSACNDPGPGVDEPKPLPAEAGTIQGPTEVVDGESITLTVAEIEEATSYKWYRDDVAIDDETQRTLEVTTGGVYKVAGVNENGEGKASPNHTVALLPAPSVPAAAGTISGPNSFVEGSSITLTIAEIEGATSYKWYRDDAEIDDETGLTLQVDTEGTYKVAGVNEIGEGDPSPDHEVVSTPVPVVPVAPGTPSADKYNPIVTGETVTLTITAVADADSYQWYKGDEKLTGEIDLTLVVAAPGLYSASAINEVGEGEKSATVEVTFIPAAAGAISASVANPVPKSTSVRLTVAEIPGATNYRWFESGVEKMTSAYNYWDVSVAGVYTVRGVNATGVGEMSAAYTVEYEVTPVPDAAGTITCEPAQPVMGQSLTLRVPTINNAVTYKWMRNGSSQAKNNAENFYTIATPGTSHQGYTFTVEGVNSEGVSGTKSAIYTVNLLPATPSSSAKITSNNANPTEGQTVTLTAPSITGATSYKWYKDDVAIGGQTANTLAVTESGEYKVAGVNTVGEGAKTAGLTVTFAPPSGGDGGFIDELVGTWSVVEWVRSGSTWSKFERELTIAKNANGTSVDITKVVDFKLTAMGNMAVSLNVLAVPVDNVAKTIKFPTFAVLKGFQMGDMNLTPFKTDGGTSDKNVEFPAQPVTTVDGKLTMNMYTFGTADPTANGATTDPMIGVYTVSMQGTVYAYVCNSVWTKKD